MKIKILTTVSVAAMLAWAAAGQSGAGASGSSSASGTVGGTGVTGTSPGNSGGINSGVNSGTIPGTTPSLPPNNPNLQPPLNANGNTPVVGGGIGINNTSMASNNLGLGTNSGIGIGSNQFAVRTNSFGNTNFLTPTGRTNGFNAPPVGGIPVGTNGNAILIQP